MNETTRPAVETAKIMILDDDPGTIDLVRFHLGELGYRNFVACTDATDGLRQVAMENPDVLLLDLVMPGLSGLEILAQLRVSRKHALLPVIILTILDDVRSKTEALELGATDFLNKPVDFLELAPRIRNALAVKAYHDQLKSHADELKRQVERKTASLKKSHAELQRANQILRRSCEEAAAATRVKSQFLANISHEIRTPLTAIIGFTEELLADPGGTLPPRSAELLPIILRNGKHLLEIVNDVLDVAKIERGRLPIECVACSPAAILADVARLLRPEADAKGLELAVETPSPIPETIHSDPTRLRQILINLVNNAIKFTEKGSVRVVSQLLGADGPVPMLQFEVIDTGMGIERDQLAEIFKPFTQTLATRGSEYGGTGLGLTICKYLAEELGGQIQVESRPGRGSTFRVTVATGSLSGPRPQAQREPAAARPEAASPGGESTGQASLLSNRILLAEDAPDNQRLIGLILTTAGAQVTIVGDGRTALEEALAAWRHHEPFDVILTDIQMPVLNGYDLAGRLREQGYGGPIIALTANAMVGEHQKCLAAGCDDYLSKPIDRARLLSLVAQYAAGVCRN